MQNRRSLRGNTKDAFLAKEPVKETCTLPSSRWMGLHSPGYVVVSVANTVYTFITPERERFAEIAHFGVSENANCFPDSTIT